MSDEPRKLPSSESPQPNPPAAATPPPSDPATPANLLTPEEQMALFEQELKETDWGHQPC
jgi:hypothetical protein